MRKVIQYLLQNYIDLEDLLLGANSSKPWVLLLEK